MINPGDTFLLSHSTHNRPAEAKIIRLCGFHVIMEGEYKGKKITFREHQVWFLKKNPRWAKQLSLFETTKASALAKKHLK